MPYYLAFVSTPDGADLEPMILVCSDDAEALKKLGICVRHGLADLWQGKRFVGIVGSAYHTAWWNTYPAGMLEEMLEQV